TALRPARHRSALPAPAATFGMGPPAVIRARKKTRRSARRTVPIGTSRGTSSAAAFAAHRFSSPRDLTRARAAGEKQEGRFPPPVQRSRRSPPFLGQRGGQPRGRALSSLTFQRQVRGIQKSFQALPQAASPITRIRPLSRPLGLSLTTISTSCPRVVKSRIKRSVEKFVRRPLSK